MDKWETLEVKENGGYSWKVLKLALLGVQAPRVGFLFFLHVFVEFGG